MSSQRGNAQRSRTQKYANSKAYKNNLHGETRVTKILNNLQVCSVCEKCTNQIEWRIKFNKYKPLTGPAKCVKCEQKCVKYAYHMMCGPCAEKLQVCAKCGEKKEVVVKAPPSAAEQARMDSEFQMELKMLPERRRRTILRYLATADKKKKVKNDSEDEDQPSAPQKNPVSSDEAYRLAKQKMATMKLDNKQDDDDDDSWFSGEDDENSDDLDSCGSDVE